LYVITYVCISPGEEGVEVAHKGGRLLAQLAPGDSHDPPAGRLKTAVPLPVALKRGAGPVYGMTVQLDDKSVVRPKAVDLDPRPTDFKPSVESRPRYASSSEQPHESILELAAGEAGCPVQTIETGSDCDIAAVVGVSEKKRREGQAVVQAQDFGLPHCAFELVGWDDRGEVEEGASHRRQRDAPIHSDLVRRESRAMPLDRTA
jgi:hypothetical protein